MAAMSIGKFTVLGPLGRGAHSSILHVRREEDLKEYALKVVPIDGKEDQKYLDQAKHEFRVAQMLRHPNLIKIYALEMVRDWLFRTRKVHLLIEYAPGTTLDNHPALPMPKLLPVAMRIAAALNHMHLRGVYHGDLKPNNIILGKRGEPKIIDYGLATIRGEPKQRIQGTPEYMAPETVTQRVINEQTDIYNFGATLYRLVTFRVPPKPIAATESMRMVEQAWSSLLKPVADLNPSVPGPLCELIHRCMAFRPENRPARMSEIQEELDRIAGGLGIAPAADD